MTDLASRRGLLRGGAAAALLAALTACDRAASPQTASPQTGVPETGVPVRSAGAANVQVSRDQYWEHVGPSLAANPARPGQLLAACQGSPFTPEFVLTYLSGDGGANWHQGGRPPQPTAGPAGDDVTVAFGG